MAEVKRASGGFKPARSGRLDARCPNLYVGSPDPDDPHGGNQAFVREVACEILGRAGYRVLQARNAAEGTEAFRGHVEEVALLRTDLVFPDRKWARPAACTRGWWSQLQSHLRLWISGERRHPKRTSAFRMVLSSQTILSHIFAANVAAALNPASR